MWAVIPVDLNREFLSIYTVIELNVHAFEADKRQDNDNSCGQYSNDCG